MVQASQGEDGDRKETRRAFHGIEEEEEAEEEEEEEEEAEEEEEPAPDDTTSWSPHPLGSAYKLGKTTLVANKQSGLLLANPLRKRASPGMNLLVYHFLSSIFLADIFLKGLDICPPNVGITSLDPR